MLRTLLLKVKLKRECREYSYRRLLDEREVEKLMRSSDDIFSPSVVAELVVGCVKLTAVLFSAHARIQLGYDLYVKDSSESSEWILFENLCDIGDSTELSMLRILDEAVSERGLSYTECSFAKLDGERVNYEQK